MKIQNMKQFRNEVVLPSIESEDEQTLDKLINMFDVKYMKTKFILNGACIHSFVCFFGTSLVNC